MQPGFTRLTVGGYRRLRSVDIPLRPINVLIGANGVGKTSILEVLWLLAKAADGKLQSTLSALGGMESILTADGRTSDLAFTVEAPVSDAKRLAYSFVLRAERLGYVIASESLHEWVTHGTEVTTTPVFDYPRPHTGISVGTDGWSINFAHKPQELALVQEMAPSRTSMRDARNCLGSISDIYHGLDVSPRAPVRTPQTVTPAMTPGLNGEDLVSCLYNLRETDRDRFDSVENALRIAFPTLDGLGFPSAAAGRIRLTWRDRNFPSRALDIGELSEGTLRFLWLTALLQSPGLPAVTLIDEPELGLHPELLRLLAELMREASSRTQLVVVTHSDRLVRFLRPEEVLVCDYDETGGFTATWADELDLTDWMQDYTLDQLWSKGILGGRS